MALTTPTTLDTATMLRELGASNLTYEEGKELAMIDQRDAKVFLEADVIEVGRGLTNYNSAQILAVKGLKRCVINSFLIWCDPRLPDPFFCSSFLPQVLGYADSEFVVENITVTIPPTPPS
jgi:glutamate 5-kinase